MKPAQITKTVNAAWYELSRTCDSTPNHDAARFLARAEDAAIAGERAHRAMGRRFTGGRAGYQVSVRTAARLIVLQKVAEGPFAMPLEAPWVSFAQTRLDCALAYAVHEAIDAKAWVSVCKALQAVMVIDYARDVAQ